MKNNILLFMLLTPFLLLGQTITGYVQDTEGNPILRAEVVQKGTWNKAYTGQDGGFTLKLSSEDPKVLLISHECVLEKEIDIKEKEHINVKMTVINANYETLSVRVLEKEADTKIKVIKPAEYVNDKNKVLKERAVLTAVTTPAEYKTSTKKVLVPLWYNNPMETMVVSANRKKEARQTPISAITRSNGRYTSKVKDSQLTNREMRALKKITDLPMKSQKVVVDESSLYKDLSLKNTFKRYNNRKADGRLSKEQATESTKEFKINIAEIVSDKKEKLSGILTAGEINDFAKWTLWNDIAQEELIRWSEEWKILPKNRYAVQVNNQAGVAIVNAKVYLLGVSGQVTWEAKTDNMGKAELWHNLFYEAQEKPQLVKVDYKGKAYQLEEVTPFEKGMNFLKISVPCETNLPIIDLAFVVDGTASMDDEIEYLKEELDDVIRKTRRMYENAELHTGSVFYRDHDHGSEGDNYLTRISYMNRAPQVTLGFMKKQGVKAGQDTPEAVTDALELAVDKLGWRDEATTRLLFLILDAPPHDGTEDRLAATIKKAAAQGIRIIPIVCSGAHLETEYLMRAIALATNGTYTFLTDHSGVGKLHLKPTTDAYNAETLNSVMVRLIQQFSGTTSCTESFDETITVIQKENEALNAEKRNKLRINFFPNPTSGVFTVNAKRPIKDIFVTDVNGKLLLRQNCDNQLDYQLDISAFAAGIYVIRCDFGDGKWGVGRLVVMDL